MAPRGGKREKAGRTRRAEGELTEVMTCRLLQSNKAWVKGETERTGKSLGEIMDLAVTVLREDPEKWFPDKPKEEE